MNGPEADPSPFETIDRGFKISRNPSLKVLSNLRIPSANNGKTASREPTVCRKDPDGGMDLQKVGD